MNEAVKTARRKTDPRIEIVVKVMEQSRFKRLDRMLSVRDMRRKDGRFTMKEEASEIIAALDAHDAAAFDTAFQSALAQGSAS